MKLYPRKRRTQEIGVVGLLDHDPTISSQVTLLDAIKCWVVGCCGYMCVGE